MPGKFYDAEFSAEILRMLKKRDVLAKSNPAQLAILCYNLCTEAEAIVRRFDAERRENPLLETTPAEAWLAAELGPVVRSIRENADVDDVILTGTLERYFRHLPNPVLVDIKPGQQRLCTSVEPYFPLAKKLLTELYDRKTSLRTILRIPAGAYTVHAALKTRKPSTELEATVLQGIKEGWSNQRIAKTLDEKKVKPRNFASYREMLRLKAESFHSLKHSTKRKYTDALSIPHKGTSNSKPQI